MMYNLQPGTCLYQKGASFNEEFETSRTQYEPVCEKKVYKQI